jgi:putative transposase
MPRTARASVGGLWYRDLDRGKRHETVFHQPCDCDAFIAAMLRAEIAMDFLLEHPTPVRITI